MESENTRVAVDIETPTFKQMETRVWYSPQALETMMGMFPDKQDYQCATHIAPTVNRLTRNKIVDECMKTLKHVDFDTFAFQGTSGIGISLILAYLLQKEVIIVRKPDEQRQAWARYKVEGYKNAKRYIIVDDLISTGTTAARVFRGVRDLVPKAELGGILLYYQGAILVTPDSEWKHSWEHVMGMVDAQDLRERISKEQERLAYDVENSQ